MNYERLLSSLGEVHRHSWQRASATVNRLHVLRNWAIGCLIVEYEQCGEDRAAYGQEVLKNLSEDLKAKGIAGLGLTTLKGCRSFFRIYPQIGQPAVDLFPALPGGVFGEKPPTRAPGAALKDETSTERLPDPLPASKVLEFSWSHLLELIRIDDPWKRAFYGNETLQDLIERDTATWLRVREEAAEYHAVKSPCEPCGPSPV